MFNIKTFISKEKPAVPSGLWLKPVDGGFVAYLIEGGTEKPLKIEAEDSLKMTKDSSLVGSVQDDSTANTINGAKAYAKDLRNELLGNPGDEPSDLTLYGLRSYIEDKTAKKYGSKGK